MAQPAAVRRVEAVQYLERNKKGPMSGPYSLDFHDINSFWSAISFFNIELHSLAFGQCLEPLALNRGKMNKDICTVVLLDKTKTL